MRIFTIVFLLIVIAYPNYSYSQIVNMESARKENLLGAHYELNFGLNGSSGTIDRTNYSLEGRIDLNSEKLYFSMMDGVFVVIVSTAKLGASFIRKPGN